MPIRPHYLDVAIVQLRPSKGVVELNRATLAGCFQQLADQPPNLVVLPEAALTGYFLEGGTSECACSQEEIATFLATTWQAQSKAPIEIVCGFFENADGIIYNSAISLAVTASEYYILHVHRKLFLPTYGVFDEARFLSRGRQLQTYEGVAGRCGVAICEDLWHSLVPTLFALKGVRVIIVPSASPGRGLAGPEIESVARWHTLLSMVASEHGVFVLYAGLVGFEGGKAMAGASCIVGPLGKIIVQAPTFEPAIVRARIDLSDCAVARAGFPLLGDLCEVAPDLLSDPEIQALLGSRMQPKGGVL